MKKSLLALACGMSLLCSTAHATDFNGSASFSQGLNLVNPGLQVRANIIPNSGPQDFVSAPLVFSLNVGQSTTKDLFVIRTLEPQIDPDDLVAKPFSLGFSFAQGTATVTGTTYAVSSGGFSYGVMDFAGPATINLGGGQVLTITLADATFNQGTGLLFTPGKANGATIAASFQVSAVPEPGSLALMLAGMAAVAMVARRRRLPSA